MKLDFNCITCNINQAIKIMELSEVERSRKEEMMRAVLNYLSNVDYNKCNPEVIAGTWDIILKHIENDNPYADIKKYYNKEVLKMVEEIESAIETSEDNFNTVLKIAISGNLIDFTAKHKFDVKMLKEQIMNIEKINLAIDDSKALYERLKVAKSLMYLGDNCGEICLDKLFIKYIKKEFPRCKSHVNINEVEQGMVIKGKDKTKPVLLFLHGGPAMHEYAISQRYPTVLENYFTACCWEQRGSGLSYNTDISPETMTVEQLISDALEVTNYLRKRFGQEKIYLMGHSWGTFLGIQAALSKRAENTELIDIEK